MAAVGGFPVMKLVCIDLSDAVTPQAGREKTLRPPLQGDAPARATEEGLGVLAMPWYNPFKSRKNKDGEEKVDDKAMADAGNGRYLVEIEAKEYNGNISVRTSARLWRST